MGTGASKQGKGYKTLENVLDHIASNYILTSDFKSLSKLYDEEYCKDLVLLTENIINKNFNEMEVTYLAQRLKGKEVVNEETTDKLIYTTKQRLDKADESSKLRKKRRCQGIAKFYVRIAHVFSAIVMTINPVYIYKDENGNTIKTPLIDKDNIPKGAKDRRISREGMCYNRINQLRHGQNFANIPEDGNVTLSPNICADRRDMDDEPGIPELESLYYDKFNYETGKFSEMKPSTRQEYEKDVQKFYKVFTGRDTLPENPPRTFGEIKLDDYDERKVCSSHNPTREKITGNMKDELFKKYANTIRDMVRKSYNVQNELLGIINQLFKYYEKDGKHIVRVNPELSETSLDQIVEQTRNLIINYYLTCEKDYTRAVKLYETIVENQIKDTTKSQIQSLNEVKNELIDGSANTATIPPPAPPQEF